MKLNGGTVCFRSLENVFQNQQDDVCCADKAEQLEE
jgi:hypothetical protein